MVSLCLEENEEHESKVAKEIYIGFFNVETLYVGRGRKPRAQASRIFHYFLNMVTLGYYVTMEKEKTKQWR